MSKHGGGQADAMLFSAFYNDEDERNGNYEIDNKDPCLLSGFDGWKCSSVPLTAVFVHTFIV